ncbi:hypothetical protein [Leuconostoc pseudomesenteroides]|uniref:hypothetical protein n=1 Tax=Leuconostoc pseudomesenteroides TaxID=33968 RepID=UPI0032DEE4CC
MTKKTRQRDQKLKQYLKQLHDDDWHRPALYQTETATTPIKTISDYYYAQLILVLLNNYHQSLQQAAEIVGLPKAKAFRLSENYHQNFKTLKSILEAVKHG